MEAALKKKKSNRMKLAQGAAVDNSISGLTESGMGVSDPQVLPW